MNTDQSVIHAVYPGTFDPVTNGHLDIIRRAVPLFSKITVVVINNPHKRPLFDVDQRKELIRSVIRDEAFENVAVDTFDGLLVQYAKKVDAKVIIRGLRAVSDFDYEFQMALMNRKLRPELETVYLMPSEEFTYLNSTIVKEVAKFKGNIDCFLPIVVADALRKKIEGLDSK